jgi:predicted permease
MRSVRRAWRHLRRSPAFASAAIASLALGIGANSAIFTLTDALLFRPLPVKDPGALLHVAGVDPTGRTVAMPSAFVDLLRGERLFAGVCGFLTPLSTADIAGRVGPLSALALSGDCFDTLGLRPALGRFYTLAEDRIGASPVVVLSYDEWQQDFGGQLDVLGKTIRIEGTPFTVVGVTERRFTGLLVGFPVRLIFPIAQLVFPGVIPAFIPQDMIARTKPAERIEQVRSRIDAEWPQLLNAATPPNIIGTLRERFRTRRPLVAPVSTGIDYSLRGRFERPLLALLAISGLVLLVSCVNVASLLLARGIERQRDTVVRVALGARRATLVKDALVESSMLLAAGGILGVLMAVAAARVLVAIYGSANSTFDLNVAPDSHTVWFACAVSAAAFLGFAVGPAWKASRVDIAAFQAASSRVAGGRSHVRRVVVIAQVALTLVLVAVGSLFIGALSSLREAPLGFTVERILDTRLAPLPGAYDRSFRAGPYYAALLDAVADLPGIDGVAIAHNTPFVTLVQAEPVGVAGSDSDVLAEPQIVTDAFFRTMEIPLAAGEEFRRTDEASGRRTVIVSQSLARVLFGVDNAIGKRIRVGSNPDNQALEIVGVARDAVLTRPQQRNTLVAYLNYWQAGQNLQVYSDLLVRTRNDPSSLAPALRRELQRLGREYPGRVRPLAEQREAALAQERLLASLSTAFGALGLLLAAVGLYGLLSFSVASRTAEIGVRMALGAGRRQVIDLVLREAATLLVLGAALGVPLAWIAGQTAARLLFGLDSPGLLPIGAAVLLLALVGATAASIPAHRAASIDPLRALKHD